MKHLKSYKVFENSGSGNAQFDWLRKQNNERFFKLADILYSEVFDEYDVIEKKDESFDGQADPTHKFWGFNLASTIWPTTNGGFVKNKSEISDTDSIKSIFVYNIPEHEESEFYELLKSLDERVFDYCEKHLVVTQESYVNDYVYFDFIISFGDETAFYNELGAPLT